jgi:hypothetical protein
MPNWLKRAKFTVRDGRFPCFQKGAISAKLADFCGVQAPEQAQNSLNSRINREKQGKSG